MSDENLSKIRRDFLMLVQTAALTRDKETGRGIATLTLSTAMEISEEAFEGMTSFLLDSSLTLGDIAVCLVKLEYEELELDNMMPEIQEFFKQHLSFL